MDTGEKLAAAVSDALGAFADLRVSASAVLLILVAAAVWRVADHPARSRRAADPAVSERTSMPAVDDAPHPAEHDALDALRRVGARPVRIAGVRVRLDRAVLAAAGALGVVLFALAGLGALFGAATGGTALTGLALAAGALAALRALALHDARARAVEAAATEAEPEAHTPPRPVVADPERDRRTMETVLGLEDETAEPEAPAPALASEDAAPVESPGEHVPAARPTAAGSTAATLPAVPRPTYLDAPEVVRPMPEPYEAEPAPASRTRLSEVARAAQAEAHRDEHEGLVVLEGEEEAVRPEAARQIAALDLDGVLARRRAG